MKKADVLVVGAGAAGAMAAYTLAKAGKNVIVLEAGSRIGGRIHTIHNTLFFNDAELGAEFVHGNLPVTLNLLQEAGIKYHPAGGEMWRYHNGNFTRDTGMIADWDLLMEKLNSLQQDMPLQEFLEQHFNDSSFRELRNSVCNYAAGYDTADPKLVSAFGLRREWQNEDEDAQYRIKGGYCRLIKYLTDNLKQHNGALYLNAAVESVEWQPGKVEVTTATSEVYEADKIVFAVPLGVWQAPVTAKGFIKFDPPVGKQMQALQKLGFGAIIKVLLQFDNAFWEDALISGEAAGENLKNMGFLFSDEVIPTWWTQAPHHSPLLTGWLGGPAAAQCINKKPEEILLEALQSLSNIFNLDATMIKSRLVAWHVVNWTANAYTYGSYSYDTVHTTHALQLLNNPVNNTLYFAGEFMYQGNAMGTVEAALISGRDAAQKAMLN